jgi:hypothetical protein
VAFWLLSDVLHLPAVLLLAASMSALEYALYRAGLLKALVVAKQFEEVVSVRQHHSRVSL